MTSFTRTLSLRPWICAVVLLAGGAAIANTATPLRAGVRVQSAVVRMADNVITLSPVIVHAPSLSDWRSGLRRDTVARMLRRKHVDSATARRWAHEFVRYGDQLHVNPKLLVAIAYAESEFNPSAYSHAGAIGLMQVVPSRASWREYEPGCGRMTARNLHEPHVNICFGAHIYREFLTRHHGDTDHALAAYNNGSGELNGYPDRVYSSLATLRH
ncbi:MAG: lytic transglycosylase domain-containing protein [Gemmatimonadaceae bacterium]